MAHNRVLDTVGLMCPMPLVKLSKAIRQIGLGEVLEIRVDDTLTLSDLPLWCKKTGHELVGTTEDEEYTTYLVKRMT